MKNLPVGIQTFDKIIKGNYLYVDKTKDIYNILARGEQYYFLSRPRRFGKSLLISTLEELFSGNKELFAGLWIYDKIEWRNYPVISIDFTKISYKTADVLEASIKRLLEDKARAFGIKLDKEKDYKESFSQLIEAVSGQGKVVVLIDEYDKPIIDRIEEKEIAAKNRDVLREFYSVIKAADKHIKFVFITGVSKFSKVSVFSGLNNLRDITLSKSFSQLLGYTEAELRRYFAQNIEKMAAELGIGKEELLEKIRRWYNGYSWDGENFVYNPFSILNLFTENSFGNFWFASGTPTFLIKTIREHDVRIEELENYSTDSSVFESYDIERLNAVSLLFQTGYLTVGRVEKLSVTRSRYFLTFPNIEVKESLLKHVLADFTGKFPNEAGNTVFDLIEKIESNDLEGFITILKSLFAAIPAHIFIKNREAYYHSVIYLVLTLLGVVIQAEVYTNKGRIDAVIETGSHIYILEFKMGTAAQALTQVKENKYFEKYMASGKEVVLIGIGFDVEQKNLTDYTVEALPKSSS
ncbi:MAG: ATP-binding protein [Candidatus Aminicenantes bacterium]|nr:ATP-binding protein [Candidatus Aminicenantes bacterium]